MSTRLVLVVNRYDWADTSDLPIRIQVIQDTVLFGAMSVDGQGLISSAMRGRDGKFQGDSVDLAAKYWGHCDRRVGSVEAILTHFQLTPYPVGILEVGTQVSRPLLLDTMEWTSETWAAYGARPGLKWAPAFLIDLNKHRPDPWWVRLCTWARRGKW